MKRKQIKEHESMQGVTWQNEEVGNSSNEFPLLMSFSSAVKRVKDVHSSFGQKANVCNVRITGRLIHLHEDCWTDLFE